MDLSSIRNTFIRFTFNEANIILENILGYGDKSSFITRLQDLRMNTSDSILQEDLDMLIWKISQISESDYLRVCSIARSGQLLFPGDNLLAGSK